MRRWYAAGLAAAAVLAAAVVNAQGRRDRAPAEAASEYLDRTPETCISLTRLRDTEILDDRTILFYMRGGDAFINLLDNECFGLEASDRFMTETRTTRLCSADLVQTFRQFGASVYPGTFCRLGDFYPLTRAEAELLEMEPEQRAAAQGAVVLTPLEGVEISEATPESGATAADGQPDATASPGPASGPVSEESRPD